MIYITAGGDAGAKINAAVAALGSGNPGQIIVPPGNYTATTLIILGKQHTLVILGNGTFATVGIRFSDSTTDYSGRGLIECPDQATIELANGANTDVISQLNFAALTGSTSSPFGVWRAEIRGCTIHGNKANNSAGFGIRLFGHGMRIENVTVQNAAQDGLWIEGNNPPGAFTTSGDDAPVQMTSVKLLYNGGNGLTLIGPSDATLHGLGIWGNGLWGLETSTAVMASGVNIFANAAGGLHIKSGGSILGNNVQSDSAAGWGMLADTGAGATVLSSSAAGCGGCVGIEYRTPGNIYQGNIRGSSGFGGIAVKFNGGAAAMHLTSGGSNDTWFDCTNEIGKVMIDLSTTDGAGTLRGNGCWTGNEDLRIHTGHALAEQRTQLDSQMTFAPSSFANLPPNPFNGTVVYCFDCLSPSVPCFGGGTGALAVRQAGIWACK